MPPAATRRAAIVAHPERADLAPLRSLVAAAEREFGWAPSTWHLTAPEQPGDVLARDAAAAGHELVIAAGGDGTVRSVAEALAGSEVPLGIVAAGTGNLLARNLGIPSSHRHSVRIAFGGTDRRIDVGRATVERPDGSRERLVFTVLAGVGIDAGMIEHTSNRLKRQVGWPAYLGGILHSILDGGHLTARLQLDEGRVRHVRARSIMVGNCGQIPGGVVLLPDARVDDERLDVAVLSPRGLIGWLQVWFQVLVQSGLLRHTQFGRKLLTTARRTLRVLSYEQAQRVRFRLQSGPQSFEVDGDAAGEIIAASLRVEPQALLVRVQHRA